MKVKKFIRSNPHLPVFDLLQTLAYYRDRLGFYDEWTWKDKDGNIKDGGIRRDDMRLLFGEDPDFVNTIHSYEKSRFPLLWFVEDIEQVYAEFRNHGIEITDPLKTHPYGMSEFSFIEINGYYVRIAEENP